MADKSIVVYKSERRLFLMEDGEVVKEFGIVLGFCPEGTKEIEGDGKTPEGEFYVALKNPKSKYHLALALSYPTPTDAERGLADGLLSPEEHDAILDAHLRRTLPLQQTKLGGAIYIHGGGVERDWTHGCVAVIDSDMDEIYEHAEPGTSVTILA